MKKKLLILLALFLVVMNVNVSSVIAENLVLSEVDVNIVYNKTVNLNKLLDEQLKTLDYNVVNEVNNVTCIDGKIKGVKVGYCSVRVEAISESNNKYVQILNITVIPRKVTNIKIRRSAANKNMANYDSAILQWKKQEGASYEIYRATKKNGKYKKVGTLKNAYWKDVDYEYVQWVDTGKVKKLNRGQKYYYKIIAYYEDGKNKMYGEFSNVKKVKPYKLKKCVADYVALPKINKIRKKRGLKPILWNFEADKGAKIRAKELEQLWSHGRPNGKYWPSAYTYMEGSKTTTGLISENIASGCRGTDAINSYMNSKGHRRNIICSSTEDLYYVVNYETGEQAYIPGKVCGFSMWTCIFEDEGCGNAYVITEMAN